MRGAGVVAFVEDCHFNDVMEQDQLHPPAVIALVRDLMFSSKISSTARAMGVQVKMVRDAAQLGVQAAGCLLVDLNQDGAIAAASQWREATGKSVVGFVSHVDSATIARAREAGIDQVMARSQFVGSLPAILRNSGDV